MKKKILWLGLSFLLVAALLLSSCGKAEPGEQEEEEEEEEPVGEQEEEEEEEPVGQQEEEEEPAVGAPQYGGTLTVVHRTETTEGIPDPSNPQYPCVYWLNHVTERMITGGIEKYGPRGTGEYSFKDQVFPPEKYIVGSLAESWEINPGEVVLHIRPGVYWSGISINPVMESREYTADDFVYNFNRAYEADWWAVPAVREWADPAYVVDRYTAIVPTKFANPMWWFNLTYVIFGQQLPPETYEAGARDWNNIVGTGPFVITKYVPGTYITYAPNPLYWRKTTINGTEYQIPFIAELVMPVIADEVTAIAALRTAKFDMYNYVDFPNVEHLAQTTPELLSSGGLDGGSWRISLRIDKPPFDDVNVRRALFLGTDKQAVTKALTGLDFRVDWPIWTGSEGYTPLEELPAETRLLYDYDPELAKQMLADAGYPDGFKANMYVQGRPLTADLAEWVASEWKRNYNIDLTLLLSELAVDVTTLDPDTWDAALTWEGQAQTLTAMESDFHSKNIGITGGNRFSFSDPYVDQQLEKAKGMVDVAERTAIYKEIALQVHNDALAIPFGWPAKYNYWWPWVKNYYGESYYFIHNPPYDLMWIDQDLKAEMGY